MVFPINIESSQTVSRHVLLSYTERYAIEYLNRKLRPYWQRNGQTPQEMLEAAEAQFLELDRRGKQFDTALTADWREWVANRTHKWPRWHFGRLWLRMA